MRRFASFAVAGMAAIAVSAHAAESGVTELEGISVTSRAGWSPDSLPRAATFITADELQRQLATGRSLADVLAELVPGMAPSSGTFTNYSQTVRGRSLQLLIDGVPQGTNRNVSRDLFTIDPDSIARIEVIRGASTLFGGGAVGGLVNIVTKNPAPGKPAFDTRLGLRSSLTDISGDALSTEIHQGATGGGEIFSWRLDATWRGLGAEFDADGHRIAPEPSQGDLFDAQALSISGKLMAEWDAQSLSLFVSDLDAEQDTNYAADPFVSLQAPGTVPARAIPGLVLDEQNQLENHMFNLAYHHDAIGSSTLDTQIYQRDYATRFYPFDGRAIPTWNAIAQSFIDSETRGARLTVATPWKGEHFEAVWSYGLDYSDETTAMPVTVYDPDAYDASNGLVFLPLGDRTFMPRTEHASHAAFVQFAATIDAWSVGAGLRHERVDVSHPDFVTLGQGNAIAAGAVDYAETFGNVTLAYRVTDRWQLFSSYAEGFELPDIGLQLRYAPAGFDMTDARLAPMITESVEAGVRFSGETVDASVAVFETRSDLGRVIIENFSLAQSRVPERIYGFEATLDARIGNDWRAGGTLTWLEGEQESPAGDLALNSYRIPPMKLTGYLDWQQSDTLAWRAQLLYSGSRDRAADDGVGFGGREVEDYVTADVVASWRTELGHWQFGMENVFNADYYNVYSQLLRSGTNTSHLPATGRTLTVRYGVTW